MFPSISEEFRICIDFRGIPCLCRDTRSSASLSISWPLSRRSSDPLARDLEAGGRKQSHEAEMLSRRSHAPDKRPSGQTSPCAYTMLCVGLSPAGASAPAGAAPKTGNVEQEHGKISTLLCLKIQGPHSVCHSGSLHSRSAVPGPYIQGPYSVCRRLSNFSARYLAVCSAPL